jgi:hypothetical protein
MTNTTRTAEDQDWIEFCNGVDDDLPEQATALQLGAFFFWLMTRYNHSPNAMKVAMAFAFSDYQEYYALRELMEATEGATIH